MIRVTARGDRAVTGSEKLILRLDNLSSATNHNGGAIHFGEDGKLYVAVGDNANSGNAQSLRTLKGKILRINKDGTIPDTIPSTSGLQAETAPSGRSDFATPSALRFSPTRARCSSMTSVNKGGRRSIGGCGSELRVASIRRP